MLICDDATHWAFLAEGRHHAVFKYIGGDTQLVGKVLRVEKIIPESRDGQFASNQEIIYCRNVVEPWLSSKYTVNMQAVNVTQEFIHGLDKLMMSIERRKEEIDMSQRVVYLLNDLSDICRDIPFPMTRVAGGSSYAIELKVKNGFKCCSPFSSDSNLLKYMCSKFEYMQYVKLWECRDGSRLPWGGNFDNVSRYSPYSLCSRHKPSVASALQCLVRNPQNNLKVSRNGQHIYGLTRQDLTALDSLCVDGFGESGLHVPLTSPSYTTVGKHPGANSLVSLLTVILCGESVLERLQLLQALDVLDVDGMAYVFTQACARVRTLRRCSRCISVVDMVSPCDACQEEVLGLVEQQLLTAPPVSGYKELARRRVQVAGATHDNGKSESLQTRRQAPSGTSPVSVALHSAMLANDPPIAESTCVESSDECLLALRQLSDLSVSQDTTPEDRAKRKAAAAEVVRELSLRCCVRLLCVWLTALAASDASVVVTLAAVTTPAEGDVPHRSRSRVTSIRQPTKSGLEDMERSFPFQCIANSNDGVENIRVIRRQTEQYSGIIAVGPVGGDSACSSGVSNVSFFAYEVSVIDVGPKSINKIKEKIRNESETCSRANKGHELAMTF